MGTPRKAARSDKLWSPRIIQGQGSCMATGKDMLGHPLSPVCLLELTKICLTTFLKDTHARSGPRRKAGLLALGSVPSPGLPFWGGRATPRGGQD